MAMIGKPRFHITRGYHGYGLDILQDLNDKMSVATEIIMQDIDPATCIAAAPLIKLRPDDLQNLMDELYRNGFRPSLEVETCSHLADMRKLVASAYDVSL